MTITDLEGPAHNRHHEELPLHTLRPGRHPVGPGRRHHPIGLYALSRMDTPVTDAARLRKFIGPPLQESFREYFPGDDDAINRAILHYREHYRKQGMRMNYPYPGIMELLADLHRRTAGYPWPHPSLIPSPPACWTFSASGTISMPSEGATRKGPSGTKHM